MNPGFTPGYQIFKERFLSSIYQAMTQIYFSNFDNVLEDGGKNRLFQPGGPPLSFWEPI